METKTDLERCYEALDIKRVNYQTFMQYYDGEQPLTYTASRLKEVFQKLDAYFAENWCSVVIDSCKDRINLRRLQAGDANTQRILDEIFEQSELGLESDAVHEGALVLGEAYFIGWPGADEEPQGYFNDARLCHLIYDAEHQRIKRVAAKWFDGEDDKGRMTLYYPDRLEYYRASRPLKDVHEAGAFEQFEVAANPYGEIPVFRFSTNQRRAKSDLSNVIPVQNGINKLLTDMLVTAEYAAFPQRYIISNAETTQLKNAPNQVWDLPAGDGMGQQTMAGQFPAADLENYIKAIDNLATAISSITRTPKHYFFSVGSNLSGEALMAMEAPLNKKAKDRIERFEPVWNQVAQFLLKLRGVEGQKVRAMFDQTETQQPFTQAQARLMNVQAGIPIITQLRREGWSDSELEMLRQEQAEDAERMRALTAQAFNAGAGE